MARLATVGPDGRPHVVPVTFAFDGRTIVITVYHKPKMTTSPKRLRNMPARAVASMIVYHYYDD